jgi:hypothetical protein
VARDDAAQISRHSPNSLHPITGPHTARHRSASPRLTQLIVVHHITRHDTMRPCIRPSIPTPCAPTHGTPRPHTTRHDATRHDKTPPPSADPTHFSAPHHITPHHTTYSTPRDAPQHDSTRLSPRVQHVWPHHGTGRDYARQDASPYETLRFSPITPFDFATPHSRPRCGTMRHDGTWSCFRPEPSSFDYTTTPGTSPVFPSPFHGATASGFPSISPTHPATRYRSLHWPGLRQ